MPGKIFVNYRRDDTRDMAARVRDRLAQTFGDSNVFMDVEHVRAGQRFDRELEQALKQTDVFLAVIGPRWIELLAERQASEEDDYVREEIAGALKRGLVVIPVLVERTALPRAQLLPKDIQELVLHQKHVVTHEQFGRDLVGLAAAIRVATKARRARGSILACGVATLLLLGSALGGFSLGTSSIIQFAEQPPSHLIESKFRNARGHDCKRVAWYVPFQGRGHLTEQVLCLDENGRSYVGDG